MSERQSRYRYNPRPAPPKQTSGGQRLTGTLHYKYMPRTGEWGVADVAYAVLTPASAPNRVVKEHWRGEGTVQFHKARWEDLPTQYNIVNAFHELEVKEWRGRIYRQNRRWKGPERPADSALMLSPSRSRLKR